MYLFGYAGTGKTYLIISLLQKILKLNIFDTIHICSPTHPTLDLLKSQYYKFTPETKQFENAVKIKFAVIHSLLKLKPLISYKNGEKIFCKLKKKDDNNDKTTINRQLVIIDECSMIAKNILSEIKQYSCENQAKIIFLGDISQLPPVGEKISQVFDNFPLNYKYTILLDQIMRTKSDNIKTVSKIVRNSTNNMFFKKILKVYENRDNCSFMLYHKKTEYLTSLWFKKFIKQVNNTDCPIVLTWTNPAAKHYNNIIRSYLHNSADTNYKINDRLIVNSYHLSSLDKSVTYTSKFVKVVEIETIVEDVFKWQLLKISNPKTIIDKFFNTMLTKLYKMFSHLQVDYMKICTTTNPPNSDLFNVKTINNNLIQQYNDALKVIRDHFNSFYSKYQSKVHMSKLWNHYHNQIIDQYIDLSFGYSITVHKAQGTTFNTVYVDVNNILENNDTEESIKCLYTAVSRASISLSLLM